MLCMRQLGWKRNLAKACPEKPFWVKKAQERSRKRYKMPKPAHKKVSEWKRLRKCHARCQTSHNKVYDCVTGWILACYRWCFACANWDERGILLRPAQKNLSKWKRVKKVIQAVQDAKHHTTKVYGFGPWLPGRMDSSMLPMRLYIHQLGWKRNVATACP